MAPVHYYLIVLFEVINTFIAVFLNQLGATTLMYIKEEQCAEQKRLRQRRRRKIESNPIQVNNVIS